MITLIPLGTSLAKETHNLKGAVYLGGHFEGAMPECEHVILVLGFRFINVSFRRLRECHFNVVCDKDTDRFYLDTCKSRVVLFFRFCPQHEARLCKTVHRYWANIYPYYL